MFIVILLGVSAVLFTYFDRYKSSKNGLLISFILIYVFIALRFMYGNDYIAYLNGFIEINSSIDFDLFNKSNRLEPGWLLLCRLFKNIGFFSMIAVLAIFNCIVFYKFIKTYVPQKYYWFAIFIYIFTPEFMLISLSAMRQSIAILLFIISLKYIYQHKIIPFIFCIGIATLFHFSVIILVPFYFLGYLNFKINKWGSIIIVCLYISLFIYNVGSFLGSNLNSLIILYFENYSVYQGVSSIGSGLGIIFFSMLFILTILYESIQKREIALLFKLAIIGVFFIPLSLIVPMIGRLDMYFLFATIVTLPTILLNLKRPVNKFIFALCIILMTGYQFYNFMHSDTYGKHYSTYQTILSSSKIY